LLDLVTRFSYSIQIEAQKPCCPVAGAGHVIVKLLHGFLWQLFFVIQLISNGKSNELKTRVCPGGFRVFDGLRWKRKYELRTFGECAKGHHGFGLQYDGR
jgi:hypothetical protein